MKHAWQLGMLQEIVTALSRLIRKDFVRVIAVDSTSNTAHKFGQRVLPLGSYDNVYFEMTERGRVVHSNWNPTE